jgi:hypothetical protein
VSGRQSFGKANGYFGAKEAGPRGKIGARGSRHAPFTCSLASFRRAHFVTGSSAPLPASAFPTNGQLRAPRALRPRASLLRAPRALRPRASLLRAPRALRPRASLLRAPRTSRLRASSPRAPCAFAVERRRPALRARRIDDLDVSRFARFKPSFLPLNPQRRFAPSARCAH